MRDIASCLGEHAVKVTNSTCSSTILTPVPSSSMVTCIYKANLSTRKQLPIAVTWSKNEVGYIHNIIIGTENYLMRRLDNNSHFFPSRKGNITFESGNGKVEVYWDLSYAKYRLGPDPICGFYVAVVVDSDLVLLLGDMDKEVAAKKFHTRISLTDFVLVSRKEYIYGKTLYSTSTQFCDNGIVHDILIKWSAQEGGDIEPELSVFIDKKEKVHVKRLLWNFRGNHTIFVDGLLIDMTWDFHAWFFNPAFGYTVLMFKNRNGLENRIWLEEKWMNKENEKLGFSFLIYASKM